MRNKIGKYDNKINALELKDRMLCLNTLILAEQGSGKTNLACKIRNFAIDSNVPTFYMDFSNSFEENIELRYKDSYFNYIQFSESEEFDKQLAELIKEKKHIYMAVSPEYFSNKKDERSKLSKTIANTDLLQNYYYFFHDIENLNGFYTKFEDFLLYMLGLMNMQKYGFTFLAQPHSIFENQNIKLLFSFLYLGRCSNLNYFNTSILKTLDKNRFYYQARTDSPTLLFNKIESNLVTVDEYIPDE
ncbi:ATP-binding protein [Sulfurimonas aquatica]|uniref:ATP-binding protein n=1 Tax=Sulfurimonas aquatica TaxID=2672570 RepID=A0A975AY80_9BACT|nr:ATP-binding protein [Sulfurimonas aquatica]QSZ40786.1 ATP-binding protein [Sulfurimonas aquatica]